MFAFCTPEQTEEIHLQILAIEEEIFQALGLAYHIIDTCTGDLGGPAIANMTWRPGCRAAVRRANMAR